MNFYSFQWCHNYRDHLRKSKHRHFRLRKWPIGAIYTTLLGWSIINSAICHREDSPTFFNFEAKPLLVKQLLQFCNAQLNLPREVSNKGIAQLEWSCSVVPQWSFDTVMIDWLNPSLGHFPRWQRNQRQCKMHTIRSRTHYFCSYCGVYLHCKFCFEIFHTYSDLKSGIDCLRCFKYNM